MYRNHSEWDAIEEAHLLAARPTPGEHDVEEPDPYCFGDDPCVCIQIKAARENERQRLTSRVPLDSDETRGNDHDPVCPPGFKPYGRNKCHICAIIDAARESERTLLAPLFARKFLLS